MNKRALRKYADPRLHFSKTNGLLYCPQIKYIIRTATKNIDGTRTLVLYLYETEKAAKGQCSPAFTVFQTRSDFITMKHCEDGSKKWLTSNTDYLNREWRFTNKCAFYTVKDGQRVTRYCDGNTENAFSSLNRLQNGIKNRKELERRHKKERIILQRMKDLPSPPRDLKGFIHREAAPQYIFYDYHRSKKQMEGYCTACRHAVKVVNAKHNKLGICPHCKKAITFKSRGRRGYIFDRGTAQVVQRLGNNELVLRIFKFYYAYRHEDIPKISIYENARAFISWDEDKKANADWYYHSYNSGDLTPWKSGTRPIRSYWQDNFEADSCGYLYTRNLEEVLSETPWKYSQLEAFYLHDRAPMQVIPYLREYLRHPTLEYLVKLRLYRLAHAAVYGEDSGYVLGQNPLNMDGRNIGEVLGTGKQYLPLMQEVDINRTALGLMKKLLAKSILVDSRLLRWCQENAITDADELERCLKHTSAYKLIRYLQEQSQDDCFSARVYYRSTAQTLAFGMYKDYIRFCEDLDYDLTDDFILYPRHLKEAHDRTSEMFNKRKAEITDQKIAAEYAGLLKQYRMTRYGLMIVPPKTAAEIVEEGHALHHCVGGYVSRVANKECVILFLRKKEEPDKPFYTIEVKDGEVQQIRGYDNCDPPPKVEAYMKVWENKKLLPAAAMQQAA